MTYEKSQWAAFVSTLMKKWILQQKGITGLTKRSFLSEEGLWFTKLVSNGRIT
jgi:hypothetical protein